MNNKILYAFLVLGIASLLLFYNALKNDYNMDDSLVLTNNHLIDDGNISSIFSEYSYQSDEYNFAYRPLTIFTFYIENLLFGKSPFVSHVINLILYLLLNFIIFRLLFKITNNFISSLLITLLFLSFPLHTEVVDNIKNRDEIFVAITGFLSIYYTINAMLKHKIYYLILIFLLSLIGIFFKESFLIFPLIIALTATLYVKNGTLKKRVKIFAKYLIISGSAFIIKLIVMSYFLENIKAQRTFEYFENPLFFSTITQRILPAIYVIGYYVSLLIFPFKLSYYYGFNTIHFNNYFSFTFVLGVLIIGLTPVFLYYLYRKFSGKHYLIIIGISLLLINLLAISNAIKPLPGIVAERLILNGSLGYCILLFYALKFLIHALKNLNIKKELLIISTLAIISSFSIKTYARNKVWKNEITLYAHDIKNIPNSVKANEMLANNYFKKYYNKFNGNYLDLSEKYYLNALSIYPILPATMNNLGTINFIRKDYNAAITYYTRATKLKNKPITHYNLAECYKAINSIATAKKEYEIALISNPKIPNIFSAYKNLVIKYKLVPEGINFLAQKMLIKHQNNLNTYLLLIDLNKELHNYKSMIKYLKIANKISPNKKYLGYIKQIATYLNKTNARNEATLIKNKRLNRSYGTKN